MDIVVITAKLIFIVFTLGVAIGVPALVRKFKPELMPDMTEQIFKAALYVYVAIVGIIMPVTTWLATYTLG